MPDYLISVDANGNVTGKLAPAPAPIPTPSPILPSPSGYTTKVFADSFRGSVLDGSKWWNGMADQKYGPWRDQNKLQPPFTAAGNDGQNNAEFMDPANVTVNNGLTITTKLDNGCAGYTYSSGSICSYNKWKFTGGLLRVLMQAPKGNGMWPGIWLLDQSGANEIDLQEGGNGSPTLATDMLAINLHESGVVQKLVNAGVDLSAAPHLYELAYVPGKSITTYLDGKQTAQFLSSVPSGEYEVILNNQVATPATSGWHTVPDANTPNPATMRVLAVEVWQ